MSLLTLLSALGDGGMPEPSDPTEPGVPYRIPSVAPYNVDQTCIIPTPEGTGQTVHPDVVDFGDAGWRGHRYWMGITPFPGGDPSAENPCIVVSDNGFTWKVPEGLTNPIEEGTGNSYHANSDTDLVYDPADDRLILTWRLYHTGTRREIIKLASSSDGVTWTDPVTIVDHDGSSETGNGLGVQQVTSQAIVRVSDTEWRMWACGSTTADTMRTATDPTGPWSAPVVCTFGGTGLHPYHADVVTGPDGRFWMLGSSNANFFPAVSTDGVTWTSGSPLMRPRASYWDSNLYRATLTPHENGTHMRVWYSALHDSGVTLPGYYSSQEWRTGYTWIERSRWLSL